MIETLISTMTYGFLGNWMFGLIMTSNGEWTGWPAYAVLLVVVHSIYLNK